MRDIIRELIQAGTPPADIIAYAEKLEAEMAETAAVARKAEIEKARTVLMEALGKYYVALGIITEEELNTAVDWNKMSNMLEMLIEQDLPENFQNLKEEHKPFKVKIVEAPDSLRDENFKGFIERIEHIFK